MIRPKTLLINDAFPHPHAVFALNLPIEKGRGTHTYDGITYELVGPDAPYRRQVSIISIQGKTLLH
ncbi:MAG: hypothetical protein H6925_05135 [Holosporaceae bacterium]|nr:MAG: hypothetical protein H6925_05135 [Holosporaceae bacterium]